MIARFATTLVGIVLIIYGVLAAISPLPLGVPLVVVGLLMVAGANPQARPLVRRLRARWRWFDKLVRLAARRSPERFGDIDKKTEPAFTNDASDPADDANMKKTES